MSLIDPVQNMFREILPQHGILPEKADVPGGDKSRVTISTNFVWHWWCWKYLTDWVPSLLDYFLAHLLALVVQPVFPRLTYALCYYKVLKMLLEIINTIYLRQEWLWQGLISAVLLWRAWKTWHIYQNRPVGKSNTSYHLTFTDMQ